MIIGITFLVFLSLGFFVFWGGLKVYGARYNMLQKKMVMIKHEIKTNDDLLKLKTKMENAISDMRDEEKYFDARIKQKKAQVESLERTVAKLEDQATAEELAVELNEMQEKKKTSAVELQELKRSISELEGKYQTINDTYAQERAVREEALKKDIEQMSEQLHEELNEDMEKFKEQRLSETKVTIDEAKVSAIRAVKDWWNDEKKRLSPLLEKDFNEKKAENQKRLAQQAAKDIIHLRDEFNANNS